MTTQPMPPNPDWQALAFTCQREDDLLPRPAPQAQEWYREGVAFYKDGMKRDSDVMLERAFGLWMKAAERKHVKAMNNVVVAYRDGEGVEQSDKKAVHWTEELIELDSSFGYYHMGTFLEQGIGVKPDRAKALVFFRKAADLGNAQGQLAAGRGLINAFAQHPDRARGYAIAQSMLQCALDQKLAEAGYHLGMHYEIDVKDVGKAMRAYQAAGKLGHGSSLYRNERIFKQGVLGTQIDNARADIYRQLWEQLEGEPDKTYPELDRICPLPPAPLPER